MSVSAYFCKHGAWMRSGIVAALVFLGCVVPAEAATVAPPELQYEPRLDNGVDLGPTLDVSLYRLTREQLSEPVAKITAGPVPNLFTMTKIPGSTAYGGVRLVFCPPEIMAHWHYIGPNAWEWPVAEDEYYLLVAHPRDGNRQVEVHSYFHTIRAPLRLSGSASVRQFDVAEFEIELGEPYFQILTKIINGNEARDAAGKGRNIDDLHDAYDADHDGNTVEVEVEYRLGSAGWCRVPAYASRDSADGPWRFRARIAFSQPGMWDVRARARVRWTDHGNAATAAVKAFGYAEADFTDTTRQDRGQWGQLAQAKIKVIEGATARGRLFLPTGSKYFRVEKPASASGATEPWLGIGVSRPWVVDQQHQHGNEYVDYLANYLQPMQSHGINFTALWLAPWSTMFVHTDPGEFWPGAGREWASPAKPIEYHGAARANWYPPACYDQARCGLLDRYMREADKRDIRYLLTLFPHDALRRWNGSTGWGTGLYGASKAANQWPAGFDRDGTSGNGFGQLGSIASFFRSASDGTSSMWLYQKNFLRYLFARYGSFRAVGMLEAIAEWEGVQPDVPHDEMTNWAKQLRATWSQSAADAGYQRTPWTISTFNVGWCLNAGIGLTYDLDCVNAHGYYGGPIQRSPDATKNRETNCWAGSNRNLDANHQPIDTHLDWAMEPWHWLYLAQRYRAFALAARGIGPSAPFAAFNASNVSLPCVLGETAMSEAKDNVLPWYYTGWDGTTNAGAKEKGMWYPTYLHRVWWIGLCTGQAVLPLKWCDGRVQGEAKAVNRVGFTSDRYPFDLFAEADAFKQFVWDGKQPGVSPTSFGLTMLTDLTVAPRVTVNQAGVDLEGGPNDPIATMQATVVAAGKSSSNSADPASFSGFVGYVIRLGSGVLPGAAVAFDRAAPGAWKAQWYNPWTGLPIGGVIDPTLAGQVLSVPLPVQSAAIAWGQPPSDGVYREPASDLVVKVYQP